MTLPHLEIEGRPVTLEVCRAWITQGPEGHGEELRFYPGWDESLWRRDPSGGHGEDKLDQVGRPGRGGCWIEGEVERR